MTPDELQAAIEGNTQAMNFLVTEFITPSAQQALENQQALGRVIGLLEQHGQAIVEIDERLGQHGQAIVGIDERLERIEAIVSGIATTQAQHDRWLQDARSQQAENASMIAQTSTKHDRMFERLDERLDRTADNIDRLSNEVQAVANEVQAVANEVQAVAEATRTQLAAIIGNGRRIDRLEQQAS